MAYGNSNETGRSDITYDCEGSVTGIAENSACDADWIAITAVAVAFLSYDRHAPEAIVARQRSAWRRRQIRKGRSTATAYIQWRRPLTKAVIFAIMVEAPPSIDQAAQ